MPYPTNDALPLALRRNLPPHAQDIWREAFNHAWTQYATDPSRQEEIAHRIAWAAVKRRYEKRSGRWLPIEPP